MNKPEVKHVTFYRRKGSFNWLNPNEKSAQYVFLMPHLTIEEIKEMGLTQSFLVDLEKDYSFDPESYSPLEVAYEIKSIYDRQKEVGTYPKNVLVTTEQYEAINLYNNILTIFLWNYG